jgi:hypothetical protein
MSRAVSCKRLDQVLKEIGSSILLDADYSSTRLGYDLGRPRLNGVIEGTNPAHRDTQAHGCTTVTRLGTAA